FSWVCDIIFSNWEDKDSQANCGPGDTIWYHCKALRKLAVYKDGLVDTGADVSIITQQAWHPRWPLKDVDVQFLGIGTLSQVKQSVRWLECIGPEGQRGRLKSYMANIAVNLWGRDLLQQWNTQIKIPPGLHTSQRTNCGLEAIGTDPDTSEGTEKLQRSSQERWKRENM
ncbi:protease, partial [Sigmodon hispidus]